MPAPDYPRSGFIAKRSSRVKHVAIIDRQVNPAHFRPICNAHSDSDEFRMVGDREGRMAEIVWWVDLNGTAFKGKNVCGNCKRVVEELWSAISGVDSNVEQFGDDGDEDLEEETLMERFNANAATINANQPPKDITDTSIGEWQTGGGPSRLGNS